MILDGRLFPICPFFTNVRVVKLVRRVNRSAGKMLIDVDSRCKLDNVDQEERLLGRVPAEGKVSVDPVLLRRNNRPGMAELPMTVRLCRASSAPSSLGIAEGTAGKVSDL